MFSPYRKGNKVLVFLEISKIRNTSELKGSLSSQVDRLDVGALVSIRGIGRVKIIEFVQVNTQKDWFKLNNFSLFDLSLHVFEALECLYHYVP